MNGFRTARTLGVAEESVCPSDEDCITKPAPALAERLIPLARAMTPHARRAVAGERLAETGQEVQAAERVEL